MTVLTPGWATHVGLVRHENEDASFVGQRVWAVADGMGGHAAGEVASRLATEAMATLDAAPGDLDEPALVHAIEQANQAILDYGRQHRSALGLGTTLAGVALVPSPDGERLCVFNVGDSRVYRFARGHLARVTIDHSEVEELVADGLITPAQARRHPLRNVVTRCLGMPMSPDVDTFLVKAAHGSRLVLCSDGLNGELSDSAIADILTASPEPQVAADALVEAAVASGGSDNVTVVVLDVSAAPE